MGLSSDILKDFANLTKQPSDSNQEYTAYGTIVEYTGAFYVKLDGSEHLTPMTTTANVKNGDRVVVSLKNHTATVIGNTTDPSASSMVVKEMDTRVSGLVADNVTVNEKLAANQAVIDDLTAYDLIVKGSLEAHDASILELETGKLGADEADLKYATIVSLEAANAVIGTLESDLGDFKVLTAGQFVATEAIIQELQTEKLSAKDIEGKYANIDFSNISKATMESFYATSGLIENVSIGDATISGRLVGVVISGDLIEGGTVVAEKLVIQGTDGLYYKLNTDGMTTEAEQTEYNSLNGGILAKKSITASKIDVKDLVAFGATIGGFVIADNSIYSGVKESIDNTTGGIYLDKEGQVCFGDSTDFLKCYKDQNGDYKLVISADSILVGSDKKNVSTVIGNLEVDVEEVRAKAVAAQSTADTAKANAATAQTAANNAQSAADTAKANATTAQSKADEAKQIADEAQKTADDADEKLAQAQAELATAQQNLADITSRVDVTEEEIEAAQAAVIAAQTKADEAVTNAATAQSTANTAKSNAEAAQNVANTAKTNAEAAQSAANEAKTIADTAKTNASNAQKAADDAQADVDALTTRVNTAETQIDQNSEAIKLRATKTEVDERLNGYYSKSQTEALLKVESDKIAANVTEIDALGTRMSTVEQTADSLTIRLANAESDIENIEVGGRNYIIGGKGDKQVSFFKNFDKVENGYGVLSLTSKKTYDNISIEDGFVLKCRDYEVGKKVVMSYDIMYTEWNFPEGTDHQELWIGQRYTNSSDPNATGHWRPVTQHSLPAVGRNGCELNKWFHFEKVMTIPEQASDGIGTNSNIQFYNSNADVEASVTFRLKNVKLEYGNKATDWTPAPEDVNSDISDAAKTATNFMNLSDTGLVIGDMTGDELGNNVLIDTDSVDIRSGDVVLASYGANKTSLGMGSKYSTIAMCDESFSIYVNTDVAEETDKTYMHSKYPLTINSDANYMLYTEYMDYSNRYGYARILGRSSTREGGSTSMLGAEGMLFLETNTRERSYNGNELIGDTYYRSRIDMQKGSVNMYVDSGGYGESYASVSVTDDGYVNIDAQSAVYINGWGLRDHIFEYGTSGIWSYRKYASGVAECWCKYTATGVNASAKNYSGFYYSESISVPLPSAVKFKSFTDFQVNGGSMDRINFARTFGIWPDTQACNFVIVGLQSGASNVAIEVYISVKGTWGY